LIFGATLGVLEKLRVINMKNIVKKILGIDKIELEIKNATDAKESLEQEAQKLLKAIELAKQAEERSLKEAEEAKFLAEQTKKEIEISLKNELEKQRLAKLTPKQLANEKKEPYFEIVNFHVNPENPRFGFWELDWNEYKLLELKSLGYYGNSDEEIIDQWFSEILRFSGNQMGISMDRRAAGFINVNNIGDGKAEVS
jgi:hypothetical protein